MTDELKQWEYDRGYEKGKADVLDKIKAEVNEIRHQNLINFVEPVVLITAVLGIIDKYREEQE